MKKICLLLVSVFFYFFGSIVVAADLVGFSGLNYFVPVGARNALYKAHASQARAISADAQKKSFLASAQNGDGLAAVGDCSISIGNQQANQRDSLGRFIGSKDNIVIVDGDVVNVGKCKQQ